MAYRRRYKKRNFRRRRYAPKQKSGWSTYQEFGHRVLKDIAYLKDLVNVEFKSIDSTATFTNLMNTGNGQSIFQPLRGTDINNITGRSCKMSSCQGYISVIGSPAAGISTRVRCAIVLDKQGGRSIGSTDLWDNPQAGFRNLDNRKDLVILKEWDLQTNASNVTTKQVNFYLPLRAHVIFNYLNGGTYADIDSNCLWFVAVSDQIANNVSVTGNFRIRFIDN